LCPPNSRLRQNVLKIAQEAANHALRDSAPRLISITLRRGEGGLLLEVLDDGDVGESVRSKRALPAVRGKVAPLGGSAELRRADAGWMMRVKFPCDQLNLPWRGKTVSLKSNELTCEPLPESVDLHERTL
jgi:signal transduction histidine kinase